MAQNALRAGGSRDTRSSRSNRRGSDAVLLLSQATRADALRDAAVGAYGPFADKDDDASLVEDRELHAGSETQSLPSASREHELILAGERHRFHCLTKI